MSPVRVVWTVQRHSIAESELTVKSETISITVTVTEQDDGSLDMNIDLDDKTIARMGWRTGLAEFLIDLAMTLLKVPKRTIRIT